MKYYEPRTALPARNKAAKATASAADIKRAAHVGAQRLKREQAYQTAANRRRVWP